jgi:hypothetical protein
MLDKLRFDVHSFDVRNTNNPCKFDFSEVSFDIALFGSRLVSLGLPPPLFFFYPPPRHKTPKNVYICIRQSETHLFVSVHIEKGLVGIENGTKDKANSDSENHALFSLSSHGPTPLGPLTTWVDLLVGPPAMSLSSKSPYIHTRAHLLVVPLVRLPPPPSGYACTSSQPVLFHPSLVLPPTAMTLRTRHDAVAGAADRHGNERAILKGPRQSLVGAVPIVQVMPSGLVMTRLVPLDATAT